MEINSTDQRLRADPAANALAAALRENAAEWGLDKAQLYVDFPLFREDDALIVSKALVVSQRHGVIVFGTHTGEELSGSELNRLRNGLDQVFTHVYGRLIRYRTLKASRTELKFPVSAAVFAPEAVAPEAVAPAAADEEQDVPVIRSVPQLRAYLDSLDTAALSEETYREAISVVEGGKGLLPVRERDVTNVSPSAKASLVNALEAEIRQFDRDQKLGFLGVLDGPQRIRGLAGSGKTVVLAMQAALTHLRHPDARIAFTFHTKSLYQHVKRLITRFYRQYDDRDPDWDQLQVLHAWGGRTNPGIYYNACHASGVVPLTYTEANQTTKQAFDFACQQLLDTGKIRETYDYVFVDEGQDFPSSFLRVALALAENNRMVLAYDELQTIFQAETPDSAKIFGVDEDGHPRIQFSEDHVLHKCYRNPREVLVTAHAIGFGLYSERIVQMLESEDHWQSVGYVVKNPPFVEGKAIEIERPAENSPSSISRTVPKSEIVIGKTFDDLQAEIDFVAGAVRDDIEADHLRPEDILVIAADDRNAKTYLSMIGTALAGAGIETNNLHLDSYSIKDFSESGKVTLSTVHKAKGNEAYVVYVVGIDALFVSPTIRTRNTAFTAMTRAKGWLRVSGLGRNAEVFRHELNRALAACPSLKFTYPSLAQLKVMKRDLAEGALERAQQTLDELVEQLSPEALEELLARKLKAIRSKKRRH